MNSCYLVDKIPITLQHTGLTKNFLLSIKKDFQMNIDLLNTAFDEGGNHHHIF